MKRFLYLFLSVIFAISISGCSDEDEPVFSEYTVSFNSMGGTEVASQKVAKGERAQKPAAPIKDGFVFEYWCTDEGLTTEYSFFTAVNSDITLYAKWHDLSTVTKDVLEELYDEASHMNALNYTKESFDKMKAVRTEVREYLSNSVRSSSANLYAKLQNAINALVELPYRDTKDIFITRKEDNEDMVYILKEMGELSLSIYGVDENGVRSTESGVTYTYDSNKLKSWLLPGSELTAKYDVFSFSLSSDVPVHSTLDITITSVGNPSVSKTLTIKILNYDEYEKLCMDKFKALLNMGEITLDNMGEYYKKAKDADECYWGIPYDMVSDELNILRYQCNIWAVECVDYVHTGDYVRLQDHQISEDYMWESEDVSNFPCGSFIKDWEYNSSDNLYTQPKYTLKADNTYIGYSRKSETGQNEDASEWEEFIQGFYKCTGGKGSKSGFIYMR